MSGISSFKFQVYVISISALSVIANNLKSSNVIIECGYVPAYTFLPLGQAEAEMNANMLPGEDKIAFVP